MDENELLYKKLVASQFDPTLSPEERAEKKEQLKKFTQEIIHPLLKDKDVVSYGGVDIYKNKEKMKEDQAKFFNSSAKEEQDKLSRKPKTEEEVEQKEASYWGEQGKPTPQYVQTPKGTELQYKPPIKLDNVAPVEDVETSITPSMRRIYGEEKKAGESLFDQFLEKERQSKVPSPLSPEQRATAAFDVYKQRESENQGKLAEQSDVEYLEPKEYELEPVYEKLSLQNQQLTAEPTQQEIKNSELTNKKPITEEELKQKEDAYWGEQGKPSLQWVQTDKGPELQYKPQIKLDDIAPVKDIETTITPSMRRIYGEETKAGESLFDQLLRKERQSKVPSALSPEQRATAAFDIYKQRELENQRKLAEQSDVEYLEPKEEKVVVPELPFDPKIKPQLSEDELKNHLTNYIFSVETGGEKKPYESVNEIGATGKYQLLKQFHGAEIQKRYNIPFEDIVKYPEIQEHYFRTKQLPDLMAQAKKLAATPNAKKLGLDEFTLTGMLQLGAKNIQDYLNDNLSDKQKKLVLPQILTFKRKADAYKKRAGLYDLPSESSNKDRSIASKEKESDEVKNLTRQMEILNALSPEYKKMLTEQVGEKAASKIIKDKLNALTGKKDVTSEPSVEDIAKIEQPVSKPDKTPNFYEMLGMAQEARDKSELLANIGKASELFATGLTGVVPGGRVTKPVSQDFYDNLIKQAGQKVQDIGTKYTVKQKQDEMMQTEKMRDPSSEESVFAKNIYEQVFKTKAPETLTAELFQKYAPFIVKAKAAEKDDKGESDLKKQKFMEEQKQKLEKRLSESSQALLAVQDLEKNIGTKYLNKPDFSFDTFDIKKYKGDLPGANIPLLGRTSFYSSGARQLASDMDTVLNQMIRSFAGKAVTKNELERIRSQFSSGAFNTEEEMLEAMAKAKRLFREGMKSSEAAFSQEAVKEFKEGGGITSDYGLDGAAQKSTKNQIELPKDRKYNPGSRLKTKKGNYIVDPSGLTATEE